jgi:hypothetical protein
MCALPHFFSRNSSRYRLIGAVELTAEEKLPLLNCSKSGWWWRGGLVVKPSHDGISRSRWLKYPCASVAFYWFRTYFFKSSATVSLAFYLRAVVPKLCTVWGTFLLAGWGHWNRVMAVFSQVAEEIRLVSRFYPFLTYCLRSCLFSRVSPGSACGSSCVNNAHRQVFSKQPFTVFHCSFVSTVAGRSTVTCFPSGKIEGTWRWVIF